MRKLITFKLFEAEIAETLTCPTCKTSFKPKKFTSGECPKCNEKYLWLDDEIFYDGKQGTKIFNCDFYWAKDLPNDLY